MASSETSAAATTVGPLPTGHPAVRKGKIGVILANLGTPDGTDYSSMRRYLKEFLSDTRVIEMNQIAWQVILNAFVLTTRPQKSGANYAKIWNREKNESPLLTITRAQSEALAERMKDQPEIIVDFAMRYGNPSIASVVDKLTAQGCERIVYFPLYPQYSATTTATANDKLYRKLMTMRHQPTVRSVPCYHDEPVYIDALAASMQRQLAALDFEPEVVLASYHGIPKVYFEKGDPYHCHCLKTTRLLREKLGWEESRLRATFQSRFGAQEWLQPYTDKTVEQLAKTGVKRIAVINPGFSADCIETLEEIDDEVREIFMHAGGEKYAHIACLNASDEGMTVIEDLVRRNLAGWA